MNLVRFNHYPSFSNLFNNFEKSVLNNMQEDRGDIPSVNIREDKDQFTMEMAVPGFKKKDFKINVEEQILTISSEVKEKKEEENMYTRKEFSFTSFNRSFTLPKTVVIDKIKADYTDGILYITLPKAAESKVQRQINIA